jgi:hypothetical protein
MYAGFVELLLGDLDRAKTLFQSATPDWLDSNNRDYTYSMQYFGCMFSWVLINTGDEEKGRQLLQTNTAFLDETLSARTEHVDVHKPEICYLTSGDTEKALQSIEKQLAHNHLEDWDIYHKLPMYDLIRNLPRFLAAVEERERIISEQRKIIENMNHEGEL